MLLPDATLAEAIDYMRGKAERYVQIALDHLERAEILKAGTDRIEPSPLRAEGFARCAAEAKRIGEQYLRLAGALAALRPDPEALKPGDLIALPAEYLRRASGEDFPGEAYFRVGNGDVVRAPLASPRLALSA